jgi:hypothetical protein
MNKMTRCCCCRYAVWYIGKLVLGSYLTDLKLFDISLTELNDVIANDTQASKLISYHPDLIIVINYYHLFLQGI